MIRRRAASAALVLALLAPASPSWGQTPMGAKGQGQTPSRSIGQSSAPSAAGQVSTTPPGKAPSASASASGAAGTPGQATGQQQTGQGGKIPMSAASYSQALEQSEGLYTDMQRPGPGGQVQEAWDKIEADPVTGQQRQGVYVTRLCEGCVYKVRARELMTTTLELPEDAVISGEPDLGDPSGFNAKIKKTNVIAIRPNAYGIDTNLTVFTRSGRIYPFYIRSEGYNSVHVPDLVVKILGRETPEAIAVPAGASEPARQDKGKTPKPGDKASAAIRDLTTPGPAGGDFIRNVPFDPAKLHGWRDYKLWGDDDMAKPEVIYRDDFFTYIQYGKKFDSLSLPTAYVTIDGIDEKVNTRVQGSTYIVESVEPLITLKNGKRYLCIQYTGETP